MTTPPNPPPLPDGPVTFDDLVDYILGTLAPADERHLLERIGNDPDAADKLVKLRGVDARIADAFGRQHHVGDEESGDTGEARAATLEAHIAEQDRHRGAGRQHRQPRPDQTAAHGEASGETPRSGT